MTIVFMHDNIVANIVMTGCAFVCASECCRIFIISPPIQIECNVMCSATNNALIQKLTKKEVVEEEGEEE